MAQASIRGVLRASAVQILVETLFDAIERQRTGQLRLLCFEQTGDPPGEGIRRLP